MQPSTTTTSEQTTLFINMAISAWTSQNARVAKLFSTFQTEQWFAETAPERNRGIYLLGHLIAVSDGLFPLFGLGEKLYPELEKPFLTSADKTVSDIPSVDQLIEYWKTVHTKLEESFKKFTPEDWFGRHTSVSEADFAKEPHRNKLNVLMNRTGHTAYHLGQLAYLNKK
jgi:hypothetical protein